MHDTRPPLMISLWTVLYYFHAYVCLDIYKCLLFIHLQMKWACLSDKGTQGDPCTSLLPMLRLNALLF